MDVKVGPHWYRNSDGTIEIEGVPQMEMTLGQSGCPLRVNLVLFDTVGNLHTKVEGNSLVVNEQRAYQVVTTDTSFLLQHTETKKPVWAINVTEDDTVEISHGELYSLKGHLLKITPIEWSIEKTIDRGGETDVQGGPVPVK